MEGPPAYGAQQMQPQQMMYQVQVPQGVQPGQPFQVQLGGQLTQVMCPPNVGPGAMIQVAGPAPSAPMAPMPTMTGGFPDMGMGGAAMGGAAMGGAMMGGAMMGGAAPMGPGAQTMMDNTGGNPLAHSKGLFIKQKASLMEAVSGGACEQRNKYKVYDQQTGRQLFTAKEDSECCDRCCCAPNHSLKIHVKDEMDQLQYTVVKPFAFVKCFSCCACCQPSAKVYKGDHESGTYLGEVKRPGCCEQGFTPKITLNDKNDQEMSKLVGPTCCIGSCCDTKFTQQNSAGEEIGAIEKKQKGGIEGAARELFTDADNFGIDFSTQADETEKALMLGSMFLLDFMFFEDDGNMQFGDGISVKCCDIFCCGCACPCQCKCGGSDGS